MLSLFKKRTRLGAAVALAMLLSAVAIQAQPKDKGEKAGSKETAANAKESQPADKGAKDDMAGMQKGGMT